MILILAVTVAAQVDEWEAWNAFAEGSSVTHSVAPADVPTTTTTTLLKKEAERLTVEIRHSGPNPGPAQTREIRKGGCASCKAHKKPARKVVKEKETLAIGKQEVACVAVEETLYDCAGKEIVTRKAWYSVDVPGGLVKAEGKGVTVTCAKFEKK